MTEPRPLRVLHVLPRWNHGGGAQSILAEARHAREQGLAIDHRAMPLESGGSLPLLSRALRARVRVEPGPSHERERELVESSDVVVLHWWNAPSTRAFIDRWRGRALRWILYSRVNGIHPPQRLPPALLGSACHAVLTSPHLSSLGRRGAVSVIPAVVEPPEAGSVGDGPRRGLLHVGTLNAFKLAADFVERHAESATGDVRVTVAGDGGDEARYRARADRLGIADRFAWAGFAGNPASLYRSARLLVYPAAPYTYASSDKVVQEAGMHGLPVLANRDSPIAHLIEDGVTGLLVDDEPDAYRQTLRRALSGEIAVPETGAVATEARRIHDWTHRCRMLAGIYSDVAAAPARAVDDGIVGLDAWLEFQGSSVARRERPELEEMAASPDRLLAYQCWACEGGIAQYLKADPALGRDRLT